MNNNTRPNNCIVGNVLWISLLIIFAGVQCQRERGRPESAPRYDTDLTGHGNFHEDQAIFPSTTTATSTTSTTPNEPESVIDHPINVAGDSVPTVSSIDPNKNKLCFQCYTQVTSAQKLYATHRSLVKKEKELINSNKHNPPKTESPVDIAGESLRPTTRNGSPRPRPNRAPNTGGPQNSNAPLAGNIQNRSLLDAYDNEPVILSRLRVPRSTEGLIPTLEKLRTRKAQKFTEACKSIWVAQECLDEISKSCIGNLHYHTLDVITNQWFEKLNCPPKRNPNFKPFSGLDTRSIPDYMEERQRIPVARPNSSPEETAKKILLMHEGLQAVILSPNAINQNSSYIPRASVAYGSSTIKSNSYYQLFGVSLATTQFVLLCCFLFLVMSLITLTGYYFRLPPKIQDQRCCEPKEYPDLI